MGWTWAALADPDGKIDSRGRDEFLSTGEPLISYNNQTFLPALMITTEKNQVICFRCKVLFHLSGNSADRLDFLKLMSRYIGKLESTDITAEILKAGFWRGTTKDFVETIELLPDKIDGFDSFEYSMEMINRF